MERDMSMYACVDGVYLKEEQVIKMASNAGSFAVAEHYLCALLAHGLMYGKREIIESVNKVRQQYQVMPYVLPIDQKAYDGYGRNRMDSVEVRVRKAYAQMTQEQRWTVMKHSLRLLRLQSKLFCKKNDWMAVMLVVKDRLDGTINQHNFYDYASAITPDDWPEALCMGEHTTKNFSRMLTVEDRMEAYYDMENNPQAMLCDKLWEIISQVILTEIP